MLYDSMQIGKSRHKSGLLLKVAGRELEWVIVKVYEFSFSDDECSTIDCERTAHVYGCADNVY